MFIKIKNIFFLITFITFIFFVTRYYFSEKNLISINKSRSSYALVLKKYENNLPLLKNDTDNIITYIDDIEEFKNKRKKRIWENLITNSNE